MKKSLCLTIILMVIAVMFVASCGKQNDTPVVAEQIATQGQKPEIVHQDLDVYPEYYGTRVEVDSGRQGHYVPLELPANPRWVRYWNAWGLQRGEAGEGWCSDGIMWDGQLLANPTQEPYKDYQLWVFRKDGDKDGDPDRAFMEHQVTDDPRTSNWWMSFCGDSFGTLWEAVEEAALSGKHSDITEGIIWNMIYSGVVTLDEAREPGVSADKIRRVMVAWTNLGLRHNLERVSAVMKGKRMTPEMVRRIKPGGQFRDYYWYRFGPWPVVSHEYRIEEVDGGSVVLTELPETEGSSFKVDRERFVEVATNNHFLEVIR